MYDLPLVELHRSPIGLTFQFLAKWLQDNLGSKTALTYLRMLSNELYKHFVMLHDWYFLMNDFSLPVHHLSMNIASPQPSAQF